MSMSEAMRAARWGAALGQPLRVPHRDDLRARVHESYGMSNGMTEWDRERERGVGRRMNVYRLGQSFPRCCVSGRYG